MATRSTTIKFNEKRNHYVARITTGWDENGKQVRKAFYGKTEGEVQEKLDEYEKSTKDLLPGSEKALFRVYFAKWLAIKKGEMRPEASGVTRAFMTPSSGKPSSPISCFRTSPTRTYEAGTTRC